MTPRVRYGCYTALALLALATPTGAARASLTPSDVSCVELQRWARQYQSHSPTLDDLAPFDRAHRVAIFNAVAPEVRAALWAEQFRRLLRRTDLSEVQRTYLRRAVALATPDRYRQAAPATGAFGQLWADAARAFTTPESRAAWFQLGTVEANGHIALDVPKGVARGIQCNCQVGSPFDCPGGSCGPPGGCTGVINCGPGLSEWCDGRCRW